MPVVTRERPDRYFDSDWLTYCLYCTNIIEYWFMDSLIHWFINNGYYFYHTFFIIIILFSVISSSIGPSHIAFVCLGTRPVQPLFQRKIETAKQLNCIAHISHSSWVYDSSFVNQLTFYFDLINIHECNYYEKEREEGGTAWNII